MQKLTVIIKINYRILTQMAKQFKTVLLVNCKKILKLFTKIMKKVNEILLKFWKTIKENILKVYKLRDKNLLKIKGKLCKFSKSQTN